MLKWKVDTLSWNYLGFNGKPVGHLIQCRSALQVNFFFLEGEWQRVERDNIHVPWSQVGGRKDIQHE